MLSRTDAAGDAAYYTFDAIGNTQQLTVATGSIANSYAYEPFGRVLASTETIVNRFQYIGRYGVMTEGDQAQLLLMRRRHYSPEVGRFVQMDPMGIAAGPGQYSYSENNPLTRIDPVGLRAAESTSEQWEKIRKDLERFYEENKNKGWSCWKWQEEVEKQLYSLIGEEVKRDPSWGWWRFERRNWGFFSGRETQPWEVGPLQLALHHYIEIYNVRTRERYQIDPLRWNRRGFTTQTSYASDPNQKLGPGGFGESGFISGDSLFAYRIDFENESTATAPAQIVIVIDQIDSDLDWATFEMTEIGFGDQLISIPDNSQYIETIVPMSYNGVDFEVHVEAGIGMRQGRCMRASTRLIWPPACRLRCRHRLPAS